jgi:hypothetical protein
VRVSALSADYRAMDRRYTIALLAAALACPIMLGAAAVCLRFEPLFLAAIVLCVLYAPAALLLRHEDEPG